MAYDKERYAMEPGYRRRIDGARKGGAARSKAKVAAVRRNLAKARATSAERARLRALGVNAENFNADQARNRALGLPFQPWPEWKAARMAELFGGGFEIE